ncbi:uncharacterized protein BCR38DRAFT_196501 [Pseudomassariella vexata]|uniref:Uncharacterized protein n=1 Tax=Pseudomassariella vexata TaxID=1141098 RepID=A0A1Y2E1G2_9PEZI|nr:uncharacterized protein BCR38DRAFT_196501 [Pseudomassariella vexata]ORY65388.1 hypothetical protein BCR38DRAFT_196501 [Pseudomassariella vexata]
MPSNYVLHEYGLRRAWQATYTPCMLWNPQVSCHHYPPAILYTSANLGRANRLRAKPERAGPSDGDVHELHSQRLPSKTHVSHTVAIFQGIVRTGAKTGELAFENDSVSFNILLKLAYKPLSNLTFAFISARWNSSPRSNKLINGLTIPIQLCSRAFPSEEKAHKRERDEATPPVPSRVLSSPRGKYSAGS